MTSGPTMAMLAAVRGEPYAIGYSGTAQYDYAPDVARAFLMAAGAEREGAAVYNTPGVAASVEDVVAAIRAVVPEAEITWSGDAAAVPARARCDRLRPRRRPLPAHPARRRRRGDDRALPRRRVAGLG